MPKLHVVCAANLCRSPIAAALFSARLPAADYTVESAGLAARDGQSLHPFVQAVMQAHGLQVPAHGSRRFVAAHVAREDLVLAMERRHLLALRALMPRAGARIQLLGKWLGGIDIDDPRGRTVEDFEQTFRIIERCVARWCEKLAGAPRDS